MLEHEINPNLVDELTGDSPLHLLMTVFHKNIEEGKVIMQLLVDFGANLNAKNKDNWTPLHFSVRRGNPNSTKALLEVGGNKPQKSWLM